MARQYSRTEKEEALLLYAMEAGRAKLVEPLLREAGLEIPIETVKNWANRSERERYQRIKVEAEATIRERLEGRARRLAQLGGEVGEEALLQLKDKLANEKLDARVLAKLVHEAGVGYGIGVDKSEKLAGRPTARVSFDLPGLLRELRSLGAEFALEQSPIKVEAEQQPALPSGNDETEKTNAPPDEDQHATPAEVPAEAHAPGGIPGPGDVPGQSGVEAADQGDEATEEVNDPQEAARAAADRPLP